MKHIIPVFMRDDSHDTVKVGNAQYDDNRGSITVRFDLDTLRGGFYLFGRAIDLELVQGLKIEPIASELGFEKVEELETLEAAVEQDLEANAAAQDPQPEVVVDAPPALIIVDEQIAEKPKRSRAKKVVDE